MHEKIINNLEVLKINWHLNKIQLCALLNDAGQDVSIRTVENYLSLNTLNLKTELAVKNISDDLEMCWYRMADFIKSKNMQVDDNCQVAWLSMAIYSEGWFDEFVSINPTNQRVVQIVSMLYPKM